MLHQVGVSFALHIRSVGIYKLQLMVLPQTTGEGLSRQNWKWTFNLFTANSVKENQLGRQNATQNYD